VSRFLSNQRHRQRPWRYRSLQFSILPRNSTVHFTTTTVSVVHKTEYMMATSATTTASCVSGYPAPTHASPPVKSSSTDEANSSEPMPQNNSSPQCILAINQPGLVAAATVGDVHDCSLFCTMLSQNFAPKVTPRYTPESECMTCQCLALPITGDESRSEPPPATNWVPEVKETYPNISATAGTSYWPGSMTLPPVVFEGILVCYACSAWWQSWAET